MAEGRERSGWRRTSSLMALVANALRDPSRRAFLPKDFDPTYEEPRRPRPMVGVEVLRTVFCEGDAVRRMRKDG